MEKRLLQNLDASARPKFPVSTPYNHVDTAAKKRTSRTCNPPTGGSLVHVSLDSCTPWEAGPVFAFLIVVRRRLENGEGVTSLLLLSVDPYHAVAVIVVRSVAGTPRGLHECHQPGTGPRSPRPFQTSSSVAARRISVSTYNIQR